jgi:hypothetical protein
MSATKKQTLQLCVLSLLAGFGFAAAADVSIGIRIAIFVVGAVYFFALSMFLKWISSQ